MMKYVLIMGLLLLAGCGPGSPPQERVEGPLYPIRSYNMQDGVRCYTYVEAVSCVKL